MSRNTSSLPRFHTLTAIVCGILFLDFSFTYLYVMHGELMRYFYKKLCGADTYSPLYGALGITFILWTVQWLLDRFFCFVGNWQAFAYFPAYCILAFLTCFVPVDDGLGVVSFVLPVWWWCFPLALFVYFLLGMVCRYRKTIVFDKTFVKALIPNLVILIVFSFTTGSVGNCNELLHNELLVAQCLREGRYTDALTVGKSSLHYTPSLATLRVLALSHKGDLGESLFEYPLGGKSGGLFFPEGHGGISGFTDQDIENHLGGVHRVAGEPVVDYLKRLCESDSTATSQAVHYYLCALLLEKRLDDFHQTLVLHWPVDVSLPRHYQEALLVYMQQHETGSPLASLCTSSVRERYNDFLRLQAQHKYPLHQSNYTRRKFGDTYWWYHGYAG